MSVGLRSASGGWLDGYGQVDGVLLSAKEASVTRSSFETKPPRGSRWLSRSMDLMSWMAAAPRLESAATVIAGGDTITIDGFRTSSATVAASLQFREPLIRGTPSR